MNFGYSEQKSRGKQEVYEDCAFRAITPQISSIKQSNTTYMMTQVGIHEHDIIVSAPVKTVDVCRAEAQLAGSGSKYNFISSVDFLQVLDSFLSAIWRVIVDDDDFHGNISM